MGVRTTRYCDITGTDTDVTNHELQIDQMHVEIDLTTTEYERLLALLRPFIDAGRVDASAPTPTTGAARGAVAGQPRDLLADLTAITAGRSRVALKEALTSLQQLDTAVYGAWTTAALVRRLPDAAKPYSSDGGRWISLKKLITARGLHTHTHTRPARAPARARARTTTTTPDRDPAPPGRRSALF